MILSLASVAAANDIVEIRVIEAPAARPTTQPDARAAVEVPKDPKELASIAALADADGNVEATSTFGDEVVHLQGRVASTTDGKRQLRQLGVTFSYRDSSGVQEAITNVVLALNDQHIIGGVSAGGSQRFVVATVKPGLRSGSTKAD
jgi:hypothetical protein